VEGGEGEPIKAEYWKSKFICKNWIYVKGNHDKASNSLKTVIEGMVIKLGGKRMYVVHDPGKANLSFKINLTGHVHNLWKFKRIEHASGYTDCINVGVDVWKFRPVEVNEIFSAYAYWVKQNNLYR